MAEDIKQVSPDAGSSDMGYAVFEHTMVLRQADPLALISKLVEVYSDKDYYVYEKPADACWHVALGIQSALVLTPKAMTLSHFDRSTVTQGWQGRISDIARHFIQSEGGGGWNIYGQAAFEYATRAREIRIPVTSSGESWPLLSLMVPRTEITIRHHDIASIRIRTRDMETLTAIRDLLTGQVSFRSDYRASPVDTEIGRDDYQRAVGEVLDDIEAGLYRKITLSRQVAVPSRIDMLGTFLHARPKHTPSRSFLVKFMEREVVGFSPELVMAVKGRTVYTQPLAGTRVLMGEDSDDAALRRELLSDPKEVAEHAMTIHAAVQEVDLICQLDTTKVDGFMSILERGSVQHFASMVTGTLKDDKDEWDAFDMLFPSITACGNPKEKAIEVILEKERYSRGLFSGAVLMLSEKEFEASMVLRSAFQEPGKSWIQAGAGLLSLSIPEREFDETSQKLASLAPYIVFES